MIKGLSIVNFDIEAISVAAANGDIIAGNFIGLKPDGTPAADGGLMGGFGAIDFAGAYGRIGGTTAAAMNVISGNNEVPGVSGITLWAFAHDDAVQGNLIGTDLTGEYWEGNSGDGVRIHTDAYNITVAENVISGNGMNGVEFDDAGTWENQVVQNYIGIAADGVTPLGNAADGVLVSDASWTSISNNVISANSGSGVDVISTTGSSAFYTTILDNTIGLDVNGEVALGNRVYGVRTASAAETNITANVISANLYGGVVIGGGPGFASYSVVQGNKIGTDVTGLVAFGNGLGHLSNYYAGVSISTAGNIVGGSTAAQRNVISGNGIGVLLSGASAQQNYVEGNYIGVAANGTWALGNVEYGVDIEGGANHNTIGGAQPGDRNIISGNGGANPLLNQGYGVFVFGDGTDFNSIAGDWIGVDAAGNPLGNKNIGVSIGNRASNNSIVGAPDDRNVISANTGFGINIDIGCANTRIDYSYVGLDTGGMDVAAFHDGGGWLLDNGTNTQLGTSPNLKHQQP